MDDKEVERRVSLESRVTRLEEKIVTIESNQSKSDLVMAKISNLLDQLNDRFTSWEASIIATGRTIKIIGSILASLIAVGYSLHYINLPQVPKYSQDSVNQ